MQYKFNSLLSIKFYKVHLPLAKLKTSRTNNGYHPSSQLDKQIYPIFTHLTRSSHFEGLLRHNAEMKWGGFGSILGWQKDIYISTRAQLAPSRVSLLMKLLQDITLNYHK